MRHPTVYVKEVDASIAHVAFRMGKSFLVYTGYRIFDHHFNGYVLYTLNIEHPVYASLETLAREGFERDTNTPIIIIAKDYNNDKDIIKMYGFNLTRNSLNIVEKAAETLYYADIFGGRPAIREISLLHVLENSKGNTNGVVYGNIEIEGKREHDSTTTVNMELYARSHIQLKDIEQSILRGFDYNVSSQYSRSVLCSKAGAVIVNGVLYIGRMTDTRDLGRIFVGYPVNGTEKYERKHVLIVHNLNGKWYGFKLVAPGEIMLWLEFLKADVMNSSLRLLKNKLVDILGTTSIPIESTRIEPVNTNGDGKVIVNSNIARFSKLDFDSTMLVGSLESYGDSETVINLHSNITRDVVSKWLPAAIRLAMKVNNYITMRERFNAKHAGDYLLYSRIKIDSATIKSEYDKLFDIQKISARGVIWPNLRVRFTYSILKPRHSSENKVVHVVEVKSLKTPAEFASWTLRVEHSKVLGLMRVGEIILRNFIEDPRIAKKIVVLAALRYTGTEEWWYPTYQQ